MSALSKAKSIGQLLSSIYLRPVNVWSWMAFASIDWHLSRTPFWRFESQWAVLYPLVHTSFYSCSWRLPTCEIAACVVTMSPMILDGWRRDNVSIYWCRRRRLWRYYQGSKSSSTGRKPASPKTEGRLSNRPPCRSSKAPRPNFNYSAWTSDAAQTTLL